MKRVSVFDFDNYRVFLKETYASLKGDKRGFSFRSFSRAAGFSSQSVLKGVMDGKRNIALGSIEKFAKALRLNKEEAFFFHHLVLMNQAKTVHERVVHAEQLLSCRKLRAKQPLAAAQFDYYRRWYYVPIRELVALEGFREDPEWISHQITPKISSLEAATALGDLKKLGLVKRDAQGRLVQADSNLSTGEEVMSTAICIWHQEMLKRASESIDRHDFLRRDISAVTLGVSRDAVERVKNMIQAFRKAIIEECSKDLNPESVFQLSIQLFPLSEPLKKGEP